jgi:hypothetical protein
MRLHRVEEIRAPINVSAKHCVNDCKWEPREDDDGDLRGQALELASWVSATKQAERLVDQAANDIATLVARKSRSGALSPSAAGSGGEGRTGRRQMRIFLLPDDHVSRALLLSVQ